MTTITFLCPNGHQLTARQERAGKSGECPKCHSKFIVPDPGAEDAEQELDTDPSAPESPGDDTIEFLCPNGHRLTGPASLQGKPGKCPHCGARFVIPSYDEPDEDMPEPETVEPASFSGLGPTKAGVISVGATVAEAEKPVEEVIEFTEDAVEIIDEMLPPEPGESFAAPPPITAEGGHALSQIFLRLWVRRGDVGAVEVHLHGGEVLRPDSFSAVLSREDYAVFAATEEDGSHTITSVPWESVERVGFRNLKKLPSGLFE